AYAGAAANQSGQEPLVRDAAKAHLGQAKKSEARRQDVQKKTAYLTYPVALEILRTLPHPARNGRGASVFYREGKPFLAYGLEDTGVGVLDLETRDFVPLISANLRVADPPAYFVQGGVPCLAFNDSGLRFFDLSTGKRHPSLKPDPITEGYG